VLNESSDGLAFAELGVSEDRQASGVATLPGRGALSARLRLPYWLVPGDLLLAGPVLAFTSPRSLMKIAVGAANGGLIPWQAVLIPTPGVPPINATLVTLNSFQMDFPIMEYRPFHIFSLTQSSALNIQPYIGFDSPTGDSVMSPAGAPTPHLHTIVTSGIRVVFDWRHYLQ